jgi:hypothetical protein
MPLYAFYTQLAEYTNTDCKYNGITQKKKDVNITILDIIRRPVFILKHDFSET